MSYKIVRNSAGEALCFGPNTEQYQPGIPAGATLTIEASIPAKSQSDLDKEASAAAKKTIAQVQADIFPYLLNFVAGLPSAPANIKAARDLVNAEKAKVKP